MMCVGMPVSFNAAFNRSAGLVTFTITFPTLHFNGLVGTMTPPHLGKKALLRRQQYRDAVIKYVKANVPDSHPLVAKGWRSLPAAVTSLPLAVAMPSE